MSDGYRTYVFGETARLDMERPMGPSLKTICYMSNWRILHIDGFEPLYWTRPVNFKWEIKANKSTTDPATHTLWINAGPATEVDQVICEDCQGILRVYANGLTARDVALLAQKRQIRAAKKRRIRIGQMTGRTKIPRKTTKNPRLTTGS